MTVSQIKFLVSVALVLALWRIFELPGVATAFWSFVTVGTIPGSERTIDPETLWRSLCILFAIVFFLVFRKEFIASLPHRGHQSEGTVSRQARLIGKMATVAVSPAFKARNSIIITLTKPTDRSAMALVRPIVVALGRAAAWIVQLTCWIEADLRQFSGIIARHIRKAARRTGRMAAITSRRAYSTLLAVGRYTAFVAILSWKLAEPHIRCFDSWLDRQLHANKSTAEALDFLGGVSRSAREAYQRAEQMSRKLRVK